MNVHGVELIEAGDMVCKAHRREPGGFEGQSVKAWLRAVKAGRAALDIGAYSGLYAILAAQRGAEAQAWEPNPTMAGRIRENAMANGAEVQVVQAAAGSRSGLGNLFMGFATSSASHLVSNPLTVQSSKRLLVDIKVPDSGLKVAAIKVDVEGAEIDVLTGLAPIITRDRPLIIAEALDEAAASALQLFMNNRGYLPGRWADRRNYIFTAKGP